MSDKADQIFSANRLSLAISLVLSCAAGVAMAQDPDEVYEEGGEVEEIVVTGTHIRGAQISDALPVAVVTSDDIEVLGFDSGDELLDEVAANGQNFFNEAENISGGVNSARGDVGAFNLRSLGTGNTLVLLNGRRVVNAPSFQTEEVGGSFVPVNTANAAAMPVYGIERIEVLKDGASALYGADAVSGVVNTVLKRDFEGLTVRAKYNDYPDYERDDTNIAIEWGKFFNDGATNVGVFYNYYDRGRVNAQEDPRWADSDFRDRIPADSPFAGSTAFRNNSVNSLFGQFDAVRSVSSYGITGIVTDSAGEFEIYPSDDPRCEVQLNFGTCLAPDGGGVIRYNLNEFRDLNSDLERHNLFVYVNHEFDSGLESFTELHYYDSDTNLSRHPSASFSSVRLRVGPENYYNPLGPCGSPNRLPDSIIGTDVPCGGVELQIDNYRFAELPRIIDNSKDMYRILQGFRGMWGDWDWESALVLSKAEAEDITSNRVSNILMQEALNDPTPAAYNPFSGGVNSNIERALIDVFRISESELKMVDFKLSNSGIWDLPAGPVGAFIGFEYREESFIDDRDPRLDGTIVFTDAQGDTFPFVSDVVNSSPTPDGRGERDVTSLFGELQIPVLDNLDVQIAFRYEDFSDVGNTTVGKFAFGWRPLDSLLVRGSFSEAYRAPNLVTINEQIVARNNTRTDYACQYAAEFGGDPDQDILDCRNAIQRVAQGSDQLVPEESDNYSVGLVFEPTDNLTMTLDFWSIEKTDTIGLFGEENHTLLDLVRRLEAGNGNCAGFTGNPAVTRDPEVDPEVAAIYNAAGICPAGDIDQIFDQYANLDTRTVEGHDVGVYYNKETGWGDFAFKYVASFLNTYEQEAGGDALILVEAQNAGLIPANYPVAGFSDLIRVDGNVENKQTARLSWRKGDWGATVTGKRIGSFYQDSLTLADGTRWEVPAMTTYNATFDYRFDLGPARTRARLGIMNVTDERAPLADRFFGYFADVHRDLGRYYYLEMRFQM
ncbi:MAG: TonB-dependent receptor [Xanthomonadales bacterium]|nr:TonB-dependent receptor [Xanthomonadales bacterium]